MPGKHLSVVEATLLASLMIISSSSVVWIDAFSALPISSFSTASVSNRGNPLCHHPIPKPSIREEISPDEEDDRRTVPWLFWQQKALQTIPFGLRLPLLLLCSVPAMAPAFAAEPAFAAAALASETQGVSAITESSLGTSVRSTVVQSAKLLDAVDLKYARFSDSLRDGQKCDPVTNRRLFDNGYRRDGSQRGNPVLGALCEPVPLKSVDEALVDRVLGGALADAAIEALGKDPSSLQQLVEKTRVKVEPAFERAIDAKTNSKSSESKSLEAVDEARKRERYNLEVYSRVRAYGEALVTTVDTTQTPSSQATPASPEAPRPPSRAVVVRQAGKKLDLLWGRNLLDRLAGPATSRYEFRSPFPKPDPEIPFPYNENQLTNALGAIEVALQKLQDGGLIGHWEISIPEDDYGEVVTIAVDDDVCLGAQILAREENSVLRGSPVVAMVRSALEDRAKIPYVSLDVFFIDPTTTKNELYNPTQLLVSVRNLGEEP